MDSDAAVTRALVESIPVKSEPTASLADRVTVVVKDIFRTQDRLLIRYSIQNHGRVTYHAEVPQVVLLSEPRSPRSLIPLSFTQLNEKEAGRLSKKGEIELEIIETEVTTKSIKPGEATVGVVSIKAIGESNDRAVIQLRFPPDRKGLVVATMVL